MKQQNMEESGNDVTDLEDEDWPRFQFKKDRTNAEVAETFPSRQKG